MSAVWASARAMLEIVLSTGLTLATRLDKLQYSEGAKISLGPSSEDPSEGEPLLTDVFARLAGGV